MQDAERQFAAENPVQISPDSQNRDCKQHETDPDADADHTVQQADAGFSRPLSTLVRVVFRYRKGQI